MADCGESTSEKQRLAVLERSDNRCEVELKLPVPSADEHPVWVRCFRLDVEIHHMLTRARGGDLLDRAGETYHLLAACAQHHRAAHAAGGRGAGLLLDGYVILDSATGGLVYTGPDEYLLSRYGRRVA